jgi:hypothetical protein
MVPAADSIDVGPDGKIVGLFQGLGRLAPAARRAAKPCAASQPAPA